MILGHAAYQKRYEGLHPGFKEAFDFIEHCKRTPLEPGEYEIIGREVYALVQRYDTLPEEIPGWEGHRKYIDVQAVLSGEEIQLYAPLAQAEEGASYCEESDLLRCGVKTYTKLRVGADQFAIYYPEDLHKPKCLLNRSCQVNKVVVKVVLNGSTDK